MYLSKKAGDYLKIVYREFVCKNDTYILLVVRIFLSRSILKIDFKEMIVVDGMKIF